MHLPDLLLLATLGLCVFFALRKILRDRKQGKCCGNCAGCGAGGCAGRTARPATPQPPGRNMPMDATRHRT